MKINKYIILSVSLFTISCYSQATLSDEEIFQKIVENKEKGSHELILREIYDCNKDMVKNTIKSPSFTSSSYKVLYIESVFLEPSEFVYQNIRKRIKLDSICPKYANKTLIINIELQNTKVSFAEEKMYEFDKNGNLLSYLKGFDDIAKAIIGLDAKEFDFIDNPNWSQGYDLRIEMNRLCGNFPENNDGIDK